MHLTISNKGYISQPLLHLSRLSSGQWIWEKVTHTASRKCTAVGKRVLSQVTFLLFPLAGTQKTQCTPFGPSNGEQLSRMAEQQCGRNLASEQTSRAELSCHLWLLCEREINIYFVWAIIIQSLCLLKTNLFPKYIYTKFLTLPLQTFIVGGLWWSPKYLYFLKVSQGIYFDVPTVWGATELQMAQKKQY